MNTQQEYRDWFASIPEDKVFGLKMDFAVEVEKAMETEGISKKELASRLGVAPARVTKILSGESNLTIETMQKIADALGCTLHLHLAEEDINVNWFDVPKRKKENSNDAWTQLWERITTNEAGIPVAA